MRVPLTPYNSSAFFRLGYRLAAFIAILFFPVVAASAQSDTTPPTLRTLSYSPASVDVSSVAKLVTVTANITDDLSGENYAYITFTSPSSSQNFGSYLGRISGNSLNGNYTGTVTIPLFAQAGTYSTSVYIADNAGNSSRVSSSALAGLGFPSTLTVVDTNPDVTPPILQGVTFNPQTVDASNAATTATVTLHITDAQTGVSFANASNFTVVLAPVGSTSNNPTYYVSAGQFTMISGTSFNGFWQATIPIPRYANANLSLSSINLFDVVGNQVILTSNQLTAAGINPILAVTSTPSDITPPTLTSFSISPSVVDTSASGQTLNLTLSATDDLSGVDFSPTTPDAAYIQFGFISPSGNQASYVFPSTTPSLVAGTSISGTYKFLFSLPQYSEQGTWKLSFASLKDATHNYRSYTPAQVQALGFSTTFVVTKPSLTPDGTIGPSGGTVTDTTFGTRASVTFPAGLVSQPTTVAIDVFASPLAVPTPRGFTVPGTYFENIAFNPMFPEPVASPGITLTLPLLNPMTPGAHLSLYHIDSVVGLAPAFNASGNPVIGIVNADGVSATFTNVVTFSTLVAYISNGSTLGDVSGDGRVDCTDVSILKSSFGKSIGQPGFNSAADLNNDGTVNILDQFIISRQLPAGMACR